MTHLVVYYSRTGNNRTIANQIAKALSADIDEIIDKKNRQGRLNWLLAGKDSRSGKLTEIEYKKNPQDYDTVIIGAPIWAWNPIPPLRTYLKEVNLNGKRVAFFICSKSEAYKDMFGRLAEMTPDSEHVGSFGIQEEQFKNEDYSADLEAFIEKIK
ncbi:flavodoxin [Candidatus Thorarchaeota archaeon]|nr:MAG: flavodoxin [Candidatus Thorarchaeota archaeon]